VVLAAAGTAVAVLASVRAVTGELETGYDAGPAGVAFVAQGALGARRWSLMRVTSRWMPAGTR
jgi:hypothetical protein